VTAGPGRTRSGEPCRPTRTCCSRSGGVATITVNRPKVGNALNRATLGELEAAFAAVQKDAAIRGAIVTGTGEKFFIAGADINELKENTPLSAKEIARRGQLLFSFVERLGKPVVAAINGFCLGGGLELARACTFRTAPRTPSSACPRSSSA
jgi:enoyl-CoA hydratase